MPFISIDPSSFRDPSGFIFSFEKEIYRAIAPSYFKNFSLFLDSGLYESLSSQELIIKHSETENFLGGDYSEYKIIKPKKIPFISYPYEWCFSQLKDAALLTLKIQKDALKKGMILKDASAYNIQFIGSKIIFIDTLSFEKYEEGTPWIAYGQFCRHFLAPLTLMHYKSPELSSLLKNHVDGIPLEIAATLLPARSILNSGIASHIILHSKIQQNHSGNNSSNSAKPVLSKPKLLAIIHHLEDCIQSLKVKSAKSNWIKYTDHNVYSAEAMNVKEKTISSWLEKIKPKTIWDLGCNTGKFSLLASERGENVLAMDGDGCCIETFYNKLKKTEKKNIISLVMNLSNPSPSVGWANIERKTIAQRGKADALLALALLHHLRIGNNVPFSLIAEYFSVLTQNLIIEYIPKDDINVKSMMAGRKDIFDDYTEVNFLSDFKKHFNIIEKQILSDSERILYFMEKK